LDGNLGGQGIPTFANNRHHFHFSTKQEGSRLLLTPLNKIFRFATPINAVEDIILTFRNPLNTITWDKDRFTGVTVAWENPARFITPSNHNLQTGDRVYIENFSGSLLAKDEQITKQNGHIITKIDENEFTVNVNLSSANPATALPLWLIGTAYIIGDEVHDPTGATASAYRAIAAGTGNLTSNTSFWQLITPITPRVIFASKRIQFVLRLGYLN
jgi:hypothetical protein